LRVSRAGALIVMASWLKRCWTMRARISEGRPGSVAGGAEEVGGIIVRWTLSLSLEP
jgi:hypothetical protein